MSPKSLKALIVTVVVALVALSPAVGCAVAASPQQPVGDRIDLLGGNLTTFPAGKPFHISHGHRLASDTDAIGVYEFELEVDGAYVEADYVDTSDMSGTPDTIEKTWVFNFPNGMTGTHTFVGHWLGPCQETDNPCTEPNAQAEYFPSTLTVTFGP